MKSTITPKLSLNTYYLLLFTHNSLVIAHCSVLWTLYSVLSTQYSLIMPISQCSILVSRYSWLMTQYWVLSQSLCECVHTLQAFCYRVFLGAVPGIRRWETSRLDWEYYWRHHNSLAWWAVYSFSLLKALDTFGKLSKTSNLTWFDSTSA